MPGLGVATAKRSELRQIVEETYAPGASVSVVARRQ